MTNFEKWLVERLQANFENLRLLTSEDLRKLENEYYWVYPAGQKDITITV